MDIEYFPVAFTLTAVSTGLRGSGFSNETLAEAFTMVARAVVEHPKGEILVEFSSDGRMRCVNVQTSTNRVVCP